MFRPMSCPDLQAQAVEAILASTQWLTYGTSGATPGRWKDWHQEGRVFAVDWGEQTLYPAYLFDGRGNPIPEVAEILKVFEGYRPFRIASWFESTNSLLRGKRPREVLSSDPTAVIAAARAHVAGPVHG
ncbi:hypothetical protein AB4Y42_14140 [Paraburkholderia sp. EG286B]|uniref:hypothetical protein n=1 Tax=Paraburkholderia sp. EG286B TaxID=3237011 RepID=UPI0034D2E21D